MGLAVLGMALGKTVCCLAGTPLSKVLAADVVIMGPTEGSDV